MAQLCSCSWDRDHSLCLAAWISSSTQGLIKMAATVAMRACFLLKAGVARPQVGAPSRASIAFSAHLKRHLKRAFLPCSAQAARTFAARPLVARRAALHSTVVRAAYENEKKVRQRTVAIRAGQRQRQSHLHPPPPAWACRAPPSQTAAPHRPPRRAPPTAWTSASSSSSRRTAPWFPPGTTSRCTRVSPLARRAAAALLPAAVAWGLAPLPCLACRRHERLAAP